MRSNITPAPHKPHEHEWTNRDERVSLRLAALFVWATGSLVAALGVIPDLVTLLIVVPAAVVCWHLSDTVEARRARAAIRYSRTLRAVEQLEQRR